MSATSRALQVRYLADVPHHISTLSDWFLRQWVSYYGPEGPADADLDLRESTNRDRLPVCLVAVDERGEPQGTVSLKDSSVTHPQLGPWVAALLVGEPHRGRGVGTALMAAAEQEARRLGYPQLYVSTDTAAGIVERRGWRAIDTAESLHGRITVYQIDL